MPETIENSYRKPSFGNQAKLLIFFVILLILVGSGLFYFYQNSLSKKGPATTPTKTDIRVNNGPYTTSGYVESIDLKNNNFKLTTFSSPKKTYLVKVVDRTAFLKFVPPLPPGSNAPKVTQAGLIQVKFKDLTSKALVEVTSNEDPTKNSTLDALRVRLSL